MKTIKLTEGQIEMLLHGYYAWSVNDGDTKDGGFSKKEIKDMKSAFKVLTDTLNS